MLKFSLQKARVRSVKTKYEKEKVGNMRNCWHIRIPYKISYN